MTTAGAATGTGRCGRSAAKAGMANPKAVKPTAPRTTFFIRFSPPPLAISSVHSDRNAAHSGRQLHADFDAVKLKDHTPCVLKRYSASAASHRCACADCAIGSRDVARSVHIQRPPDEVIGRSPDGCAKAHARNGEWIVMTAEGQDPPPP